MVDLNPTAYPADGPQQEGQKLTVDLALKQPGRISRRLSDISLERFITTQIFSGAGVDVSSGAVIYDQLDKNDLYADKEPEERTPGAEYPIIYAKRGEPKIARSQDFGGKVFVTDEARTRNNQASFNNDVQLLSNTIVRKVNDVAVATFEAALDAVGGAGTVTGNNWSAVELTGSSPTPTLERPIADLANVQLVADQEELGVEFNTWVVNPVQKAALRSIYGSEMGAILSDMGVSLYASNRVPNGTAYAVDAGQVGFLTYEQGMETETWREPSRRVTWVQTSIKPIFGITNPYSVKKITGLAG